MTDSFPPLLPPLRLRLLLHLPVPLRLLPVLPLLLLLLLACRRQAGGLHGGGGGGGGGGGAWDQGRGVLIVKMRKGQVGALRGGGEHASPLFATDSV